MLVFLVKVVGEVNGKVEVKDFDLVYELLIVV